MHTYCSECKALEARALKAEKRSKEYAAECDRYIADLEALEAELKAARGEVERLKCCGNCWKYPAANDECVCEHYGGAAGHDTERNDECWEQRKDQESR